MIKLPVRRVCLTVVARAVCEQCCSLLSQRMRRQKTGGPRGRDEAHRRAIDAVCGGSWTVHRCRECSSLRQICYREWSPGRGGCPAKVMNEWSSAHARLGWQTALAGAVYYHVQHPHPCSPSSLASDRTLPSTATTSTHIAHIAHITHLSCLSRTF